MLQNYDNHRLRGQTTGAPWWSPLQPLCLLGGYCIVRLLEEVLRIDTGFYREAKLASCNRILRVHLVASEKTLQNSAPFGRSVATLESLPIVVKVRSL